MKSKTPRRYVSPLRAAQALETQERILRAVADWMQRNPGGEFTLEAIARVADVERRTVFRHFATKEALLTAFWGWVNHRLTPRTLPGKLDELLAAPAEVFAAFDANEGLIRASLHSEAGRQMRLAEGAARRLAFRKSLSGVGEKVAPQEMRNLECVTHALYSAAAWEAMKDYAGASGREAGLAASWALKVLTDAVRASDAAPRRK